MLSHEMPQALPREEAEPVSADKTLPTQVDETEPVSTTEEKPESIADFAGRPENMLPRKGDALSEGGMETLVGQWAGQMEEMRQEEAREAFKEAIASQRGMIQEELLRDEIVNGWTEKKEGENPVFSQDQVASGKSGASEWILEKLDHVPGGKKFLSGLLLLSCLSAIPEDAAAKERKGFWDKLGDAFGDAAVQTARQTPQIVREVIYKREQAQKENNREAKQEEVKMEKATLAYFKNLDKFIADYMAALEKRNNHYNETLKKMEDGHTDGLIRLMKEKGDESTKSAIRGLLQKKYDDQVARLKKEHLVSKRQFIESIWDRAKVSEGMAAYTGKLGISFDAVNRNANFVNGIKIDAQEVSATLAEIGVTTPKTVPDPEASPSSEVRTERPYIAAENASSQEYEKTVPVKKAEHESGQQSAPVSSDTDYSLLSR